MFVKLKCHQKGASFNDNAMLCTESIQRFTYVYITKTVIVLVIVLLPMWC